MANLLERFGRGMKTLLDYGTTPFEPIGSSALEEEAGSQAAAEARRKYDQDFRAARWAAIHNGANAFGMNTIAGSAAQQGYEGALTNAANTAEALRQRRQRERRDEMIRQSVQQLAGLSDDQRTFLGAADPTTAEKVLSEHLFPSLKQGGVASRGSVVATKRAPDGEILAVVQTGDPANPVAVVRTGQYEDQSTSEMRTMLGYDTDPALARGKQRQQFAALYGAEAAKTQAKAETELPQVMNQSYRAIQRLTALREKIASLPTGPIEGRMKALYQAEMQAINSEFNQNALNKIAELQNDGVRLTPITEKELKILFSVSPSIENLPEANIAIIDRQIRELQGTLQTAQDYMRYIDSGAPVLQYRPSWYDAAPAPAPAQDPGQQPPGGLGGDVPLYHDLPNPRR